MLGKAEIGVHHVQIQQLRAFALLRRLEGEVQRQLRFAAAVIADQNIDLLHSLHPFLPASLLLLFYHRAKPCVNEQ